MIIRYHRTQRTPEFRILYGRMTDLLICLYIEKQGNSKPRVEIIASDIIITSKTFPYPYIT